MPKHTSNIGQLRNQLGMTQQQLAALVGVTVQTLQNWESSKSGTEQIEKFIKLCTVLGCDLNDLIDINSESDTSTKFTIEELRLFRKSFLERLGDEKN